MRNPQRIFLFSLYTFLFSALIFVGKSIFFSGNNDEEKYIEPRAEAGYTDFIAPEEFQSFSGVTQEELNSTIHALIYEEFAKKYKDEKKSKVEITYIPEDYGKQISHSYLPLVESFLYQRDILSLIQNIHVVLQKKSMDTRGRMKSQSIYMYGIPLMSDEEFLSVLIHEFAHYVDIYKFPKNAFGDQSQDFYDISWQSTTIIRPGLVGGDFVSGYAMTNQYEDFAESFLYYTLHNKDFVLKAEQSDILTRKYTYFQRYIFPRNLFYKENFSGEEEIKTYYWDITKIGVDVKKFLQYMQREI